MATNFYEKVVALLQDILAALGSSGAGSATAENQEIQISLAELPTSVTSGYVDVGSSALALPSHELKRGVHLKLDPAATVIVWVGEPGLILEEGFILYPGDAIFIEVADTSAIGAIAAAVAYETVRLHWVAS